MHDRQVPRIHGQGLCGILVALESRGDGVFPRIEREIAAVGPAERPAVEHDQGACRRDRQEQQRDTLRHPAHRGPIALPRLVLLLRGGGVERVVQVPIGVREPARLLFAQAELPRRDGRIFQGDGCSVCLNAGVPLPRLRGRCALAAQLRRARSCGVARLFRLSGRRQQDQRARRGSDSPPGPHHGRTVRGRSGRRQGDPIAARLAATSARCWASGLSGKVRS
jgi:hypothetical protein